MLTSTMRMRAELGVFLTQNRVLFVEMEEVGRGCEDSSPSWHFFNFY